MVTRRKYNKEASQKYYQKNKEERKDYSRKWRKEYNKKYPEKQKQSSKNYRKNNKEKIRDHLLKRRFGITLEEYNQILENQNYCCKICERHESKFKISLAVDHDHETGKIRGLLCSKCNTTLGWYEIYKNRFDKHIKRE
ncbi:hypothetical protein LCGC14_1782310 [marine sediment metagenome]|uniref:Recombination endonuclease VII n=1 Tax=marine sediment metagenome TaxID=412755 RepID=A0A0F9JUK3_9ZZZZ